MITGVIEKPVPSAGGGVFCPEDPDESSGPSAETIIEDGIPVVLSLGASRTDLSPVQELAWHLGLLDPDTDLNWQRL